MDAIKIISTIILLIITAIFIVFQISLIISVLTGFNIDPNTVAIFICILLTITGIILPDPLKDQTKDK